jgi:hypothetical protein
MVAVVDLSKYVETRLFGDRLTFAGGESRLHDYSGAAKTGISPTSLPIHAESGRSSSALQT